MNAMRVYRCLEDSEQLKRIAHEISARTLQQEGETPTSRYFLDPFAASIPVVGRSAAMCDELRMIKLVANSRCNPILIIGETGIGKEHAARAVHQVRHPHEMLWL